MFKCFLKINLVLVLTIFLLSACSPEGQATEELQATDVPSTPTPTPTPTIELLPEVFKSAINDFILAGSKLNAATGQGLSYLDYQDYYAEVGGAYELALASWPENFAPEAKEQFAQAFWGWDLTNFMWEAKINEEKPPSAPDVQRFDEFKEYAGDYLDVIVSASDVLSGSRSPEDKGYYLSDDNISILLSLASDQFEAGRELMLPLLQ